VKGHWIVLALCLATFFFSPQRELYFDFPENSSRLEYEVNEGLSRLLIYAHFSETPVQDVHFYITNANEQVYYQNTFSITNDHDWSNLTLTDKKINIPGHQNIFLVFSGSQPSQVQFEYRQSVFSFYKSAFHHEDQQAIVFLCLELLLLGMGAWLLFYQTAWLYWLWPALLLATHWWVTPSFVGYDDTFHLPVLSAQSLHVDPAEIRRETIREMKENHYFDVRRTDREIRRVLEPLEDYCPNRVAKPNLEIADCPMESGALYYHILSGGARLLELQSVKQVERLVQTLNIFILLLGVGVLFFALCLIGVFQYQSSLWIFPLILSAYSLLLHVSKGVGDDLPIFLGGSFVLLLFSIKQKFYAKTWVSWLTIIAILSTAKLFTSLYQYHDYKILSLYVLGLFIALVVATQSIREAKHNRWLISGVYVLALIFIYSFTRWDRFIVTYYNHLHTVYFELLPHQWNLKDSFVIVRKVFENVVGSYVGGTAPSPGLATVINYFFWGPLLYWGWRSLKSFTTYRWVLLGLFILIFVQMLVLGIFTQNASWASLRFSFAYLPAFFLLSMVGMREAPLWALRGTLLLQFMVFNMVYVGLYFMRLGLNT